MIFSPEETPSLENEEPKYAPLEYKLAHLGIDTSLIEPRLTMGTIAVRLDLGTNQIRGILRSFNVEPEYLEYPDEGGQELYPKYAVEFVREEKAWRDWFFKLPERMNIGQVAEAIGRSRGWTEKTLHELYPRKQRQPVTYSRDVVKRLREIVFSTPPEENWYTIPVLAELTGKDREWVSSKLESLSMQPQTRRQAATGRNFPHYPPETLPALLDAAREIPQPAGEWLTAHALEVATGKSRSWVQKRLQEQFDHVSEPRLDDMGVERVHYPLYVRDALLREVEELADCPEAGDWVLHDSLSRTIGMHAVTLTRMMTRIEVETEIRLDKKGRPKYHISPKTQQQLVELALDWRSYPEAEGWWTFTKVQKTIGRPAAWIRKEFEIRHITSETRLDKSRRPAEHYDPDLIQTIVEYSENLRNSSPK